MWMCFRPTTGDMQRGQPTKAHGRKLGSSRPSVCSEVDQLWVGFGSAGGSTAVGAAGDAARGVVGAGDRSRAHGAAGVAEVGTRKAVEVATVALLTVVDQAVAADRIAISVAVAGGGRVSITIAVAGGRVAIAIAGGRKVLRHAGIGAAVIGGGVGG